MLYKYVMPCGYPLQAIKVLNMIKVYGKPIRVNKASQDKRTQDVGANMFIGNLDPEVDEKVCKLRTCLAYCCPGTFIIHLRSSQIHLQHTHHNMRTDKELVRTTAAIVRHIQCVWCDSANTKDHAGS